MKVLKKLIALSACVAMMLSFASISNAATSDDWNINYTPGTPPAYSNQVDTAVLSYYSGGYIANCSSISGAQGRQVTITCATSGLTITGTAPVITTTGNTRRFYLSNSTTGNVSIRFTAKVLVSCKAYGTIGV